LVFPATAPDGFRDHLPVLLLVVLSSTRCKQAAGWQLEQPEPGRPDLAHAIRPQIYHRPQRTPGL